MFLTFIWFFYSVDILMNLQMYTLNEAIITLTAFFSHNKYEELSYNRNLFHIHYRYRTSF